MDTKINQETLFNPQQSREINTINLEHNAPLVEHTLGKSHATLSSGKSECISDPGSITTTKLFTKPIVFAPNLEWSVDQGVNTLIYQETLLNIFETLRNSPGGQSLRAHAFFRSGAKLQLKLSSSPFHSGKLVFFYVPPGTRSQFRESIYARVQYPCVYADAANSTTAELEIPYVAIKDFFATQNPDQFSDFGQIGVTILNPLSIGTGGQTTVNFAISLHPTQNQIALPVYAHDIQLQSVKVTDITLQAGIVPALAAILPELVPSMLEGGLPAAAAGLTGLGIGGVGASIIDGMTDREEHNMLENARKENDDLQTKLNNLDTPLNINNTSSTKDLNISAPSLSNMIGVGTEHLSLYPENTYVKHANSHSPLDDEMDLQRIAQVPSLLQIGEWADSTAPGTLLFRTNIDPMMVPSTTTDGNQTFRRYPTYLAHVTSPFAYWRGSIDYHFTFASTEQHKGKVIAAWIPFDSTIDGVSTLQPNPTIEILSLFPNEIFDLSLNKEFSFSVPYNTETPYRQVTPYLSRQLPGVGNLDDANQINSLGTLYLMVYNRLSHPTTVASTIQFNAYIKAGRDYQLRALKFEYADGNNFERIKYITLQGLEVAMETSRGGMLTIPENRVGMVNSHVSNTSFQDDESEHHLGKLLSKYYPQIGVKFTIAANTTRRISVANLPGLTHRSLRTTGEADPRWRNLINHFRDIYAFWHGSLNYFVIHNSTVNTPVLLIGSHSPTGTTGTNTLVPSALTQLNDTYATLETEVEETDNTDLSETSIYSHISNLRVNPTIEVTTPYRSIFRRLYTVDYREAAQSDPVDRDECAGTLDLTYTNPSDTDIPVSAFMFQSVGSDFRFKYLIPPPSLQSR